MTDKPRLLCAKINEALALKREWRQDSGVICSGILPWIDPDGNRHQFAPDFCGDWQYTGPLFVELLCKFNNVRFTDYGEDGWGCECFDVDDERGIDVLVIEEGGVTVLDAIARATHAMEEEG